ncbi:MAG: peptidoglycan DD-metalloendopeptidase family protein [Selenomonadaceae bacterium]|nr:peptidoglycan DD-metalloendopeptidase family protein [Selenomonadaceae bacterium]
MGDGYTIKIIPAQGETVRSINLPGYALKMGLVFLGLMLVLGAASLGHTLYSLIHEERLAEEADELRLVNGIQQEQLLQLAERVNTLQGREEELIRLAEEIRRLSAGSSDAEKEEAAGGQGGPYPQVKADVNSLNETLSFMENNLTKQRERLQALHSEVRAERDKFFALRSAGFSAVGSTTPSIWPASGVVTSPFGYRWGGTDYHPGIDIANDLGTPIVATADGVVTVAGWNAGGYGNMVDIDHGGGVMTRYGHASQVIVSAGQQVRRGQVIAFMGSTGFSTGPHVHYEVHVGGQVVNPVSYL